MMAASKRVRKRVSRTVLPSKVLPRARTTCMGNKALMDPVQHTREQLQQLHDAEYWQSTDHN
jgi:hypothetical protein